MIDLKTDVSISERILVFAVTCSKSEGRQKIERQALMQLAKIGNLHKNTFDFLFFDNGSNFREHLEIAKDIGLTYYSTENRGLWSALHWLLTNELNIYKYKHKYIHIVESDMFIKELSPLIPLSKAMDQIPYLHMVRTQEFSIKNSWRFDKKFSFLPNLLHKRRSEVDLRNTTNNSYFKKNFIYKLDSVKLYATNLNAKLPGLHRTDSLKYVIDRLALTEVFSEKDFFKFYAELSSEMGIMDRGIWYSLTDSKNNSQETASWGNKLYMKEIGYQDTRHSIITNYQDSEIIFHD